MSKLKDLLKERIRERITEATGLPDAPGSGGNSTRYTPPGQKRTLEIPALAGYMQVEKPAADDPLPIDPDERGSSDEEVHFDLGKGLQYNNKIRRDPTGELTASGMPGEAYSNPAQYALDHEFSGEDISATV